MILGRRKFYKQDIYLFSPQELEMLTRPFNNWGEVALMAEKHRLDAAALPTVDQALQKDVALMHRVEQILNRIVPRAGTFFKG